MGSEAKKVHMKLRVTELFRFQEGGWKLIHRHSDTAADRPHLAATHANSGRG
jgi:ketosteroid isomerase-like protein